MRWLGLAALAFWLAGCSGEAPDLTIGWGPDRLYAEAKDEMAGGRWPAAIKALERLESRYPFGRYAQQAQIDIAYSYYREGDRAMAMAATDRFLKNYPDHPALDYVYYLRGLINFNDGTSLLGFLGAQDLAERDLLAARSSFDAFKEVVTRFPESKYAADAEARMKYLVNAMASGEVAIARFYFRRGAYVAAANRAQGAIRLYSQAPAIEEALYILMMSYERLGLTDLRNDTERVLKLNFPGSQMVATGGRGVEKSWWKFW
jgi:outer membrane protein assembly factor BamD